MFQILLNARWHMKQLLILSVLCRIGYAKDVALQYALVGRHLTLLGYQDQF